MRYLLYVNLSEFSITGKNRIKVINSLGYANIICYKVKNDGERTCLCVGTSDKDEFIKICEYYNCSYELVRESGIINFFRKSVLAHSFVMVFAIAVIANFILSMHIWNIEVEGNITVTDERILSFLEEKGIKTGIRKSAADCENIETEIRKKYFDVTWVSAEIKGNNLIVHIKENYNRVIAIKESEPYNLIAKHNSIIESVIVRSGVSKVKKGDVVKSGDLLVSGEIPVEDEVGEMAGSRYVCADADVVGRTKIAYRNEFTLKHREKIAEEKTRHYYYLYAFNKKLEFIYGNFGKDYYQTDKSMAVKLFGNLYLPVKIGVKSVTKFNEVDLIYTKDQAIKKATEELDVFLKQLGEKEMQIVEKDVKIRVGNGKCVANGTITVLEQLSKVSAIEYKEEGTTGTDERD